MLLTWLMQHAELFQTGAGMFYVPLALSVLAASLVLGAVKIFRMYNRRNEIDLLKAQIQPHFLFNTLNRISATVPPQQEATRELIAKLADTFRYALRATKEEMVPLKDELAFIRTYLELEKERFGNRLSIRISDAGTDGVMIAPMLLQPLVENAVAHGISASVKGGSVTIICKRKDNLMLISIGDDAMPFRGDVSMLMNGPGVGLKNTALRIERIYQEQIRIEKNKPAGLIFSFSIPIKGRAV